MLTLRASCGALAAFWSAANALFAMAASTLGAGGDPTSSTPLATQAAQQSQAPRCRGGGAALEALVVATLAAGGTPSGSAVVTS